MPCINCYIAWAQQALTYAPSLILPGLVWLVALWSPSSSATTSVYGPRWLPRFVRGILAAYRLGVDEDAFLLSVHHQFGGVCYLPWPLCQYLVTDGASIQKIYDTSSKSLAFSPIRTEMQHTVFDSSQYTLQSGVLETKIFPAHGRGLAKGQLGLPLERFVASIQARLADLGEQIDAAGGSIELDLVKWVTTTMFEGATPALFGSELFSAEQSSTLSPSELMKAFAAFDGGFPLFASGMVPPSLHSFVRPLANGIDGRRKLVRHLAEWIEADMPGLEEGVVREMADIATGAGLPAEEGAKMLLGTLWALQANAPFAALHHILYLTQSTLLPTLLAELDSHLASSASPLSFPTLSNSASLPLLTSTLWETLRLSSSSFSIRIVQEKEGFFLASPTASSSPAASSDDDHEADARAPPMTSAGHLIPQGARIVSATRVSHLLNEQEGTKWDGRRFMGEEGRKRAARDVRAFGGGISVCEGRSLALSELTALSLLLLTSFTITPIPSAYPPGEARPLRFRGQESEGVAPRLLPGRVGLGIHQIEGEARFKIARRVKSV
ncbi:cytochrome P450 [Leucosporidium creatinivorum]|uniref:Cytochrome P450 n=1 Tax=Leucosporidium creatinivorum TaxID=106004 RepID=A0A1Y2G199_9BASI|nr:cytochrome P450 [Leucosporidium creatinivorum]